MRRYRAPTFRGYHLAWQHAYTQKTERESLDKLVTVEMAARAKGWQVRSAGIPGRHLLYVSNDSLLAAKAEGII